MDAKTLLLAMPYLDSTRAGAMVGGANKAMLLGGMTTVRRAAMFLAQVGEESGSLRYTEEISKGAGMPYYPYYGRTFIQITWRYNYVSFGQWCVANRLLDNPDYFVQDPARLAATTWAWLGPIWYWEKHNLNRYADVGDIVGCTQVINGGQNGFLDRNARYKAALALGARILPTGSTLPTPSSGSHTPLTGRAYVVRAGDTLSGIAARFRTTWQKIAALNRLADPNRLRIGQVLALPAPPAKPAPTPAPKPVVHPVTASTVTVRAGETLGSIAAAHHTTWQRLQALNHLANPNLIYAGQTLRVS